jgi:CrcB protein
VGFLGGYTTFSTFAVEIVTLVRHGEWAVADAYALDSLLAGLLAVWAGIAITRKITG